MKRLKGLFKDTDPVDQPEEYYRNARNIVLEEDLGAVTNEKGMTLFDSLPFGYKVIGSQLLGDNSIVVFCASDATGNSEIGLIKNDSYTTIINDDELAFRRNFKIQADTLVNSFNEKIVVWTDGLNPPRWLNIDNPEQNVAYMSVFPHMETAPTITVKSINNGEGSLTDGVFYFTLAYIDETTNDVLTNFYNVTGPISIRNMYHDSDNSSITLQFENLDTNYDRVQVAVIKKNEGVVESVELLPEMSTDITEYTYTGNEGSTPGALEEIQIDKAYYPVVQTLHLNDDVLYMGNLRNGDDIGYQPYANNIEVNLHKEQLPDGFSLQPIPANNKGYFKGETYAFYISWLLKDGGESKAYHIPGREAVLGDTDADSVDGNNQVFHYEATKDATHEMGYWENADEVYPNTQDWLVRSEDGTQVGDLRGDPVRHHSIPDRINIESDFRDQPVGITLTNVAVPTSIADRVVGYKVYYALHDEVNRKTQDQCILLNSLVDDTDDEAFYTNSPWNGIDVDAGVDYSVDNQTFLSVPFTLLRKKKNIQNLTHVRILDEAATTADAEVDLNPPWESGGTHAHTLLKVNHTPNWGQYAGDKTIPLTAKAYVESSNQKNFIDLEKFGFTYNMNNYSGVSYVVLELESALDTTVYHYVNLRSFKENLYFPFDKQVLIDTGYVHTDLQDTDSDPIYGGDCYSGLQYVFKSNRTPTNITEVGVHYCGLIESYDNLYARREGQESWQTFAPKVDARQVSAMYFRSDGRPTYVDTDDFDEKHPDNWFGYNESESALNDIKFPEIYPKDPIDPQNFITRIIRSTDNFRIFLQNDYMDLSRKRGELIKLTTYNNVLIPHLKNALVRTKGKEELRTDNITAFLGNGDIFSVKPEEIIYTKDGFGGIIDKTHSLSTPFGYFFYDAYANRFYRLDEAGLKDITDGIRSEIGNLVVSNSVIETPENVTVTVGDFN